MTRGYGVEYPAASPYVVAVGGTTLSLNARQQLQAARRRGPTVARAAPRTSRSRRAQADTAAPSGPIADVSADADPNTGAAVYDTFGYSRLGPGRRHLARLAADRGRLRAERQHVERLGPVRQPVGAPRRHERLERQLQPRRTCARRVSATTARPVSALRTASAAFAGTPPPPPAPDSRPRGLAVDADRDAGPVGELHGDDDAERAVRQR